ncbi:MAG: hypothetical protein ACRC2U_13975 [Aeromonas sp.]
MVVDQRNQSTRLGALFARKLSRYLRYDLHYYLLLALSLAP